MNIQDRKDWNELKTEVKNISQAMEKLLTNDMPHMKTAITNLGKTVAYIKGRMSVLVPLVMTLVVGFIALALYLAGVF